MPSAATGAGLWLLPAIVLSTALIVYPILDLARVALTDTGAYGSPHRYTLESFRSLLAGREFYQMAAITLVFVAASVSLQLGLGLAWRCWWTRRGGGARG